MIQDKIQKSIVFIHSGNAYMDNKIKNTKLFTVPEKLKLLGIK